ncbi:MAG TPA: protein kinase [Bryobacteraceae bacterium]|nr:protein kinase [Bryobacteraceae bacterium]
MSLPSGGRLGPYEILEPIGEGGMGEVYKARDTRLDRTVAIKTSRNRFSERFDREAHAIAALNHPHICSLYDIGPDYLVMEYVEGKPLQGPLPLKEVLNLAGQILDALDAAHRKGIVHRDLKPGNILLGKNGIKILDFGLAKIEPAKLSQSKAAAGEATQTMPLTAEGTILGTLLYMSPEQVEGQEADARSDIFAFGLVLYELITGKRPFTGSTKTSLIASILKDQPQPLRTLEPLTPAPLERIVQTCLEKDPDKRWQSAREVKHALEWMEQNAPAATAMPEALAKKLRLWQGAAALVALIALAAAGWTYWPRSAEPAQVVRFQAPFPPNVTFSQYVSLSPDGHKLVFNAAGEHSGLWIRDLDSLEWRQLPGTEGAASPFWSPDSRFLGFAVGQELKKIDVSGGPPQTLCQTTIQVGTGAWNRNGVIIFGGRGAGGLWKVSEAGGVAAPVTKLDTSHGETFDALPTFMPDGKHFIYLRAGPPDVIGMYAGSLDSKPEEQSRQRIVAGPFAASYAKGNLFFMRGNTLMAQPFDPDRLTLSGEPVPLIDQVATTLSIGVFSVSPSGALAYLSGIQGGALQLTWFDRQGKTLSTFGQQSSDQSVRLSPDGRRAAVRDASPQVPGDMWTLDFERGVRTRFTFRQSVGSPAVWSSDGRRIAFGSGSGDDTIYEKDSSGSGEEKELLKEPGIIHVPSDWSRDGRFLLYSVLNRPNTGNDMWVLPLESPDGPARKPVLLLGAKFHEQQAVLSPDMHWIAYTSDESGRNEIYVRPFIASGPSGAPVLGEGKWQISRDGGTSPRWTAAGKEIVFQAPPTGTLKMAVNVTANGDGFEPGIPKLLFRAPVDFGWDATADGKRFMLSIPPMVQQSSQIPITVVLNWPALLKK